MDTLIAPTAPVQETPAPAPATPAPAQDDRKVMSGWFAKGNLERSIGMTAEEEAAAEIKRTANGQLLKPINPLGPDVATTPPAAPEVKPATTEQPAPTNAPEAPAAPKKRVRRDNPVLDEERLVRVATKAAMEAQNQRPAPAPAPEPVRPELSEDLEEEYKTLQTLEKMNKKHEGVADKWRTAVEQDEKEKVQRVKDYARQWERENPGRRYNGDDQEHNEFMTALEEAPLPDLGYTEQELKRAERQRIKDEAVAEVEKKFQNKVSEQEQRLRKVEQKDAVSLTASESAKRILDLLEVPDLEKVDEIAKPIYKDAINWTKNFSTSAHELFNGIEKFNERNPAHQEVWGMIQLLEGELAEKTAEDPDKTVMDGKHYVSRHVYRNLSQDQQRNYWTVGMEDLIERSHLYITEEAKKTVQAQEEQLEKFAQSRGYKRDGQPAKAPAPAPVTQPKPQAKPIQFNAPSLSSQVITPAPLQGNPGGGGNLMTSLKSRI